MPEIHEVAVATDGSGPAAAAFQTACDLATLAGARLTIVAVVPPEHVFTPDGRVFWQSAEGDRRFFQELLARSREAAERSGVRAVAAVMPEGPVVEQLLNFVDEHRPDLLVVGARGLSPTRRILVGSVSDALVHHARCSVLVVRGAAPPGPASTA